MSINTPFTVKVDKNNQLIITEKKNIIPKNANAGVVEFKKLPIKFRKIKRLIVGYFYWISFSKAPPLGGWGGGVKPV